MAEDVKVQAPAPAKLTPGEAFSAALAAVNLEALAEADAQLQALVAAHAALQRDVKNGFPPHAGHNVAFDRARTFLHEAQGGSARALDAFKGFVSTHQRSAELYAAALAAKTAQEQTS